MKKFTLFLTIIFLSISAASATDVKGKIYLAGPFNYYGFMGSFSEKWEMASNDGQVFTGTFTIPQDKLIFYITDYEDEDNYTIYGSKTAEGRRIYIDFTKESGEYIVELVSEGAGDWAYENFPGGDVTFSIDFGPEFPVVTVSTAVSLDDDDEDNFGNGDTNMVSVLESERLNNLPVYNIHGLPVKDKNLTPGLYIIGGKKVIINY